MPNHLALISWLGRNLAVLMACFIVVTRVSRTISRKASTPVLERTVSERVSLEGVIHRDKMSQGLGLTTIPLVQYCLGAMVEEWTTLLMMLAVFLLVRIWWKQPKLPPGPTLIPYVGIIPGYYGSFDPVVCADYSKKYKSDIISVRYLGTLTVVLNSPELIREVMVIRKDVVDRCSNIWQLLNPHHQGIIGNSGPTWAASNRLMKRLIRDFGYDRGNSPSETLTIEEAERMNKMIAQHNGKPFDPNFVINGALCNLMMELLFSKSVPYDDAQMAKTIESLGECEGAIWNAFGQYILGTKIGRTIWKDYYKNLLKCYDDFVAMPNDEVEKHEKSFNGEVKDFCDGFIFYMTTESGLDKKFDRAHLKNMMSDLVEASIESTKVELVWFLLYMAVNPEVQERCHREVVEAVGNRTPNFDDHKKTPYLYATMYELLRIHIELPFGVHQCCKDHDIEIRGYTIPKGTPIAGNYTWMNKDPSVWKKPDEFYPEHFLENGKLVNQEKMASFSIGRRACPGEPVAKVQMYICFASWVKDFKIQMPDGVEADFEPIEGTPYAKPFEIRMIPRNSKA